MVGCDRVVLLGPPHQDSAEPSAVNPSKPTEPSRASRHRRWPVMFVGAERQLVGGALLQVCSWYLLGSLHRTVDWVLAGCCQTAGEERQGYQGGYLEKPRKLKEPDATCALLLKSQHGP